MVTENTETFCRNRCGIFYFALGLMLLFIPSISWADTGSEVKKKSKKAVEIGIATQGVHESWVEEEHKLLEEIEDLERILEHTQWQRKKFSVYKKDLETKIAGLQKKAEAMEAVNMKLLPILEDDLERLQVVMDADIPSNLTERRKSIHHAKMVLADYDMGLLDKTRAVLDATAKEVDLGHQVNVLEDEIEVDGERRRVKMLQVGRVALYAMTLDGEKAYQWDDRQSRWIIVEKDVTPIHDAIEIAEGIRLVGLSELPLAQPETSYLQEESAQ